MSGCHSDKHTALWKHGGFRASKVLQMVEKYRRDGVYVGLGDSCGNDAVFFANFCPATSVIVMDADLPRVQLAETNLRRHANKYLVVEAVPGAITVDDVIDGLADIALLKFSTEYATPVMLEGAKETIISSRPNIICDCKTAKDAKLLQAVLKPHNYSQRRQCGVYTWTPK